MLTAEYLVLDGARALAVPTTLGQRLEVTRTEEADVRHWRSRDHRGRLWLDEAFSRARLNTPPDPGERQRRGDPRARVARLLSGILATHRLLWPPGTGLRLTATLEFDRGWGLGSSATLSYLLAAWAGADAYEVNEAEFGGSGYDVAAAAAEGPLLYRTRGTRREVRPVAFAPAWLRGASLVHLGRKQDSRAGIAHYRAQPRAELVRYVGEVDALTEALLSSRDAGAAVDLLRRHEALIGYVTQQEPIGRHRFADFPGVVKSLGAWGGDFALAVSTETDVDVGDYFAGHGLRTVVPAADLLLLDEALPPLPDADPGYWPVFFYGELALPEADRAWLAAFPHCAAELVDYGLAGLSPEGAPRPAPGQRTRGMLVYLPPADVVALDLHPRGAGYRRRHATVDAGGRRVRAQVWLG